MEYTRDIREVADEAVRAALDFNHNWVGTEHFLFALTKTAPESLRAIFHRYGVTPDSVREQIDNFIGIFPKAIAENSIENRHEIVQTDTIAKLGVSSRSREYMRYAEEMAEVLGFSHVDSACFAVSLLYFGEGVSAQVLVIGLEVSPDEIAEVIFQEMGVSKKRMKIARQQALTRGANE